MLIISYWSLIGVTYCSHVKLVILNTILHFSATIWSRFVTNVLLPDIRTSYENNNISHHVKTTKKSYNKTTQQKAAPLCISAATHLTFKSHHFSKLYRGWLKQHRIRPKQVLHFALQTGNANDNAKALCASQRGWPFGWIYRKLAHSAVPDELSNFFQLSTGFTGAPAQTEQNKGGASGHRPVRGVVEWKN